MNKKAFTLIELLAVIVILAIIALIAVPIVVNIINDSKNSSDEQSVELYVDTVEKTITKKQLSNSNFKPDKCVIQSDGNLECFNDKNSLGIVKIEMKGQVPSSGKIFFRNNKMECINIILNDKKFYPPGKLIADVDNNNKISVGDKYTYKVNDTDRFNFYVLSFNDDNTVNLIMDRNICNDGTVNYTSENNYCSCSWTPNNDNKYGPDAAMTYLYNGTKEWNNVPDMIMDYEDENNKNNSTKGYISIITNIDTKVTTITGNQMTSKKQIFGNIDKPLKARLPMEKELKDVGCTTSNGSCPSWMIQYLTYYNVSNDKYSINNNNEIYQNQINGYWSLASYPNYSTNGRSITYTGKLFQSGAGYGTRPVITVPLSDLLN